MADAIGAYEISDLPFSPRSGQGARLQSASARAIRPAVTPEKETPGQAYSSAKRMYTNEAAGHSGGT